MAPSASVVITNASADTAAATVSPATLTFTTANWSNAQVVTVSGVEDDLDFQDEQVVVTVSVASGAAEYLGAPSETVDVTVLDNDQPPGFDVQNVVGLGEGQTNTYWVVLNALPADDVVLTNVNLNTALADPS